MTYLQFHSLFNLPPLLLFLYLQKEHPPQLAEMLCLGLLFLAVGLFTSPWDNAAVKKGIWGFPDHQHRFKINYLPIEEYLFFFIQTVLVILSTRWAYLTFPSLSLHLETTLTPLKGVMCLLLFLIWFFLGRSLHQKPLAPRWNYTVHLFLWFSPLILLQWIIGYELFAPRLPFLLLLSMAWGLYYTLCDLVATAQGIWHFDSQQIHGTKILNILPWEESAFFWITSLLVAQSYILLLPASLR